MASSVARPIEGISQQAGAESSASRSKRKMAEPRGTELSNRRRLLRWRTVELASLDAGDSQSLSVKSTPQAEFVRCIQSRDTPILDYSDSVTHFQR